MKMRFKELKGGGEDGRKNNLQLDEGKSLDSNRRRRNIESSNNRRTFVFNSRKNKIFEGKWNKLK